MDEEEKPKTRGLPGLIASYVTTGTGAIIGLTAECSETVKDGLEQIVKLNFDTAAETCLNIVETMPHALNETTAYGLAGLCAAKVISDIGSKMVNNEKLTPEDRFGYRILRGIAYYIGIAAGMAYGTDKDVFAKVIGQTSHCLKPFIEAATDPRTYHIMLGVVGFSGFYYLFQKPVFRLLARVAYYVNRVLNGEKG